MGPSSKLIDLRQLLAERFPQAVAPPAQCLVTGIPAIDDRVGGGLPKNAITELTAPNPSAGTALLIHALLQTAHRNGFFSRWSTVGIRLIPTPAVGPSCQTCCGYGV